MNHQYVTFYLGGTCLGVDVLKVQEVLRYQSMTPIYRAAPEVAGLINLRGQIVTAIELRRRLGMAERAEGQLPMSVIVRSSEGPLSLLVDEIGEVLDVSAGSLEPCPDTVGESASPYISGVHKMQRSLLAVLDVDALGRSLS